MVVGIRFDGTKDGVVVEMRAWPEPFRHTFDNVGKRRFPGIFADRPESADGLYRKVHPQPQRPIHRDLPIAEGLVGKDL